MCTVVTQHMPFRADINILLFVIGKMAFAKWTLFFVQCLALRRNNYFNPLLVNLLQFIRVRISGIGASNLTRCRKQTVGFFNLTGKLIHVTGGIGRIRMDNQPMLLIDNTLNIIAGMAALNTVHDRTVRIGLVDLFSVFFLKSHQDLFDSLL